MRIALQPIALNPPVGTDPARVDKVARQLEGQFAQLLIKSMREASFGDSLFPGENQLFREMYDQRIAEAMTRGRGLGLSAMIARQLGGAGTSQTPLDIRLHPDAAPVPYPLSPATQAIPVASLDDTPDAQTLDLIAGRTSHELHAALGDASPYDAPETLKPADWAAANDRWTQPTARERGDVAPGMPVSSTPGSWAPHSPEGFVASIWPHAERAARELGVDPRALVAQAALETGWGKRHIKREGGDSSHNLFGIKATGWKGERVSTGTHEFVGGQRRAETASFRAYGSVAESFNDYVRLLKSNARYQGALKAGGDIRGFAQGLQRAGYATDPTYAAKIAAIAAGPTIQRAVAAIGDAGARMASSLASAAALGSTFRR